MGDSCTRSNTGYKYQLNNLSEDNNSILGVNGDHGGKSLYNRTLIQDNEDLAEELIGIPGEDHTSKLLNERSQVDNTVNSFAECPLPRSKRWGGWISRTSLGRRHSTSKKSPKNGSKTAHTIDGLRDVWLGVNPGTSQRYLHLDDIDVVLKGYNVRPCKKFFYIVFLLATCGLGLFASKLMPKMKLFLTTVPAPLSEASIVLVKEKNKEFTVVETKQTTLDLSARSVFPLNSRTRPIYDAITNGDNVIMNHLMSRKVSTVKYFEYKKIRFIYNNILNEYDGVVFWCDPRWKLGIVRDGDPSRAPGDVDRSGIASGLSSHSAAELTKLFGKNEMRIEVTSIGSLVWDQVCTFFTVFQIFSLILWTADEYFQYAICVLVLMILSIGYQVYTVRRSLIRARDMARFSCLVKVLRDGSWIALNSMDLVPGDLYQVPDDSEIVPCDSILLTGSCMVNENVLTGESIPLLKSSASDEDLKSLDPWSESFSRAEVRCPRSTLYTGSKIIRSAPTNSSNILGFSDNKPTAPIALVLRTGFSTMKGSLVRLILYPEPNNFKYHIDAFRFILILFFISLCGLAYSLSVLITLEDSTTGFIFVRIMDIFTVAVPPALPATLSIGTGFAVSFLLKKGVSCFSPPKVSVAGKIDSVIFDKTGTVTESALSVLGVQPCVGAENSKSKGDLRVRFVQCDIRGGDGSVASFSDCSPEGKDPDPVLVDEIYFNSTVSGHISPRAHEEDTFVCPPVTRGYTDEFCAPPSFIDFFSRASQLYYSYSVDSRDRGSEFPYSPIRDLLSSRNPKKHCSLGRSLPPFDVKSLISSSASRVPPMIRCMSSCHSIVKTNDSLSGDFMDVEMFNFTQWGIYELNAMEYNAYRGSLTMGRYDPNASLANEKSITASSDYESVLELLFRKDSAPSLVLSPWLVQIVSVKKSEEKDVTASYAGHTSESDGLDSCVKSLWAVLYRSELLTIRVFEFSSESRRMSVVTKRSAVGRCIPLTEIPGSVSISTHNKYKCLEVDTSIIYESARSLEDFERVSEPCLEVYIKGAPENVRALCDPSSIPVDFDSRLSYYSRNGYRVIACASKQLHNIPISDVFGMSRAELEHGSKFDGLIVFENRLKPSSSSVCSVLNSSEIKQCICSGDNLLTSISVARQCGIIGPNSSVFTPRLPEKVTDETKRKKIIWEEMENPNLKLNPITLIPHPSARDRIRAIPTFTPDVSEAPSHSRPPNETRSMKGLSIQSNYTRKSFMSYKHTISRNLGQVLDDYCLAMSGDVFQWLQENATKDTINRILTKTAVYARMLPYQKLSLVEEYRALGRTVLFVGDGANDIAALRTADAGLSLSGSESSIAAPFVSANGDPLKVLDVIRCGRSSLVTSFCCFKYMALYSLIQFVTVLILYTEHMNISDPQLLIIDIAITLPLATSLSISRPNPVIHRKSPSSNLLSSLVLTSLIGQVCIQVLTQLSLYIVLKHQPWYNKNTENVWTEDPTPVQFALFASSLFIYLANSFTCCAGRPHREEVWKNHAYSAMFFITLAFSILLEIISDSEGLSTLLDTAPLPTESKFPVIMASLIGFVVSVMYEKLLVKSLSLEISRYLERISLLLLIDADVNGKEWNGRWSLSYILSCIKAMARALLPSSMNIDQSLLLRARAQHNRNMKKNYLVYEEVMKQDIEREKLLLD